MKNEELRRKIRRTIARIPEGSVATYGQIAAEAGVPRRARLVGQVLRQLPAGSEIPWHRIINAQGSISLPEGSDGWKLQRRRLEEEGVTFRNGYGELEKYRWRPSLDELLWGPGAD
jgi:methylated-DNA-protein-cysteine methyltransferase-like protein